jgi:hypothetical protein
VEDILYEEDLLRNAFSLKYWMRYLDAKRKAPTASRNVLYERALKHLPGSYKLWRMYLRERREQLKGLCPLGAAYAQAVLVFERALIFMHKMPRIWFEYFEFLLEIPRATHTRHAFDRALRSLPVTQHERIWPLYLKFVSALGVTETAVRVYHRYLKVPSRTFARAPAPRSFPRLPPTRSHTPLPSVSAPALAPPLANPLSPRAVRARRRGGVRRVPALGGPRGRGGAAAGRAA